MFWLNHLFDNFGLSLRKDSRQIETHSANSDELDEFDPDGYSVGTEIESNSLADPIVTIDRKRAVHGSFIAITVVGFVVLAGSVTLFGDRARRDIDGLMLLLFGVTIACICAIVAIWIRARWICVAVLDEAGVIASTLERKYDLTWGELVGARSYMKVPKDAKMIQVRVLLLLEDGRCLEAPVYQAHMNQLFRLLTSAKFRTDRQGQRMGSVKGSTLIVMGIVSVVLGAWWAGHVIDQFNNGVLFQGNTRAMVLKIAAAIAGPIGGLGSIAWGLYHIIARPILYPPGYLNGHE